MVTQALDTKHRCLINEQRCLKTYQQENKAHCSELERACVLIFCGMTHIRIPVERLLTGTLAAQTSFRAVIPVFEEQFLLMYLHSLCICFGVLVFLAAAVLPLL